MKKVEVLFKCSREVYVNDDIDEVVTEYDRTFYLSNDQKIADYLADDLYRDINEYLEDVDNGATFDFEQWPDDEQGFAYMCNIMTVKIDGVALKPNDYNKIMCEPFED